MKIKVDVQALSLNTAYPTGRNGRRFLTDAGKAYKDTIGWAAREVCSTPTSKQVIVKYVFGFSDKRRRDISNFLKLTEDALIGIWFEDDSQVMEITATKVDVDKPYVEIEMQEV